MDRRLHDVLTDHGIWLMSPDRSNGLRADLSGEDLRFAEFEQRNLTLIVLAGAVLEGADLSGTLLFHSDLSFAHLSLANLKNARIISCDASGADLTSVDMAETKISDTRLDGCCDDEYTISTSDYPLSWWLGQGAVLV